MYIIRNAVKSITRNKLRNILIGIIVLVIAVSACVALSIRQAAETTKTDTLNSMSVTGQFSFDRTKAMQLIGVGLLLTIIPSLAALISIMRYEPLKILSNRT